VKVADIQRASQLEQEVRVTMDKDNNAVLEADGHTGGDILEINTGKISGS